jgi:hypothetical protein
MQTIASSLKKLMINLPRFGQGNWWIEITTFEPDCTYYFGPFLNSQEASHLCPGYIEDLVNEGAEKISAVIKLCCPAELTKCVEE